LELFWGVSLDVFVAHFGAKCPRRLHIFRKETQRCPNKAAKGSPREPQMAAMRVPRDFELGPRGHNKELNP